MAPRLAQNSIGPSLLRTSPHQNKISADYWKQRGPVWAHAWPLLSFVSVAGVGSLIIELIHHESGFSLGIHLNPLVRAASVAGLDFAHEMKAARNDPCLKGDLQAPEREAKGLSRR